MSAHESKASPSEARALRHWSLIRRFQQVLDEVSPAFEVPPTEEDPRRTLHQRDYFSLFLLGLFNPVITSMRGLCKASRDSGIQELMGVKPVSLGSFSDAQNLFNPEILEAVLHRLVADLSPDAKAHVGGVDLACLRIVDSTLWYVLPRMDWATWRSQYKDQRAVRLHIKYRVADGLPAAGIPSKGTLCERKALREQIKAGEFYIGDRNYGLDYGFLNHLNANGCGFVMRLREKQTLVQTKLSRKLSAADKKAGVTRDEDILLGRTAPEDAIPFRLIVVDREGMEEPVWLVTNQTAEQLSAEQVAGLYRRRWEVEGFFRWLKCLLPCRHWFAESEKGVSIQIYTALICAVLLSQKIGRKPSKRMMEMLAFYQMGIVTEESLTRAIEEEVERAKHVRKPRSEALGKKK